MTWPRVANFESVLVVSDELPSGRLDLRSRRLTVLLSHLKTLWPTADVVALGLEMDPTGDRGEWLRSIGVQTVAFPIDPDEWFRSNAMRFTVVIYAGRVAHGRLATPIWETQPHAFVIVDEPSMAYARWDGFTRELPNSEERVGEQYGARAIRTREWARLRDADAVLTLPGAVADERGVVFSGLSRAVRDRTLDGRRNVLVLADTGDEAGDPDESMLRDLRAVAASVRRRVGDVSIDVVADRPWRGMLRSCGELNMVARGDLREHLQDARVLYAARPFGQRPYWRELLAAEWGIVSLPDGDRPAEQLVGLLADDERWARALAQQARRLTSFDQDRAAVAELFGRAGFAPPQSWDEPPDFPPMVRGIAPGQAFQGQVQTKGLAEHRPIVGPAAYVPLPPDHLRTDVGYEWWLEAHPQTPESVRRIREELAAMDSLPLISIVMPVYNTPPDVLDEAISSVRQQVYGHWELCIADDASTERDTVTVLQRHAAEDPRVKVTLLTDNRGIAGASNAALAIAQGDYVALLDHDDTIAPEALAEVALTIGGHPDVDFIYSDEDKIDVLGTPSTPFFKPSWSPDLHLSVNYVTHFAVYRRSLIEQLGGFRLGYDGSQDYDLSLRVSENTSRVAHIAKPIYHWRMIEGSAAVDHDAKPYALLAAERALNDALSRRWPGGRIEPGLVPGTWRARYPIVGSPRVSILIPTRNGRHMLERCLTTVHERTTYRNYEIVIIDNASDDPDTLSFLRTVDATVVRYPYRFNYARQMNLGAEAATGSIFVLLNNDMEVIRPDWLEAMVEHAQRPEVGAVGARLVFPGGRVQHEGVFVGYGGGTAGNVDFGGYFRLGEMTRNCTAVTAACLATRAEAYFRVGGMDARLRVAFNDVDLCLRLRQRGYRIVYTPYAEMFHAESASRGSLHPQEDEAFFVNRWGHGDELADPFYNPNLDPKQPFRMRR